MGSWLNDNIGSICAFIGTIVSLTAGVLINLNSDNPDKQSFIKQASVASIIFGLFAAIGIFIDSKNNSVKQQTLQDSINAAKSLGEINGELGKKIENYSC